MVRRRLRKLLQVMVKRKKKLPQVTAPRLQDTAVRKKRVLLATVNKAEV
jgi:hypothetical protein